MSYVVLARRWRPQTFEDVVGQQHITTTLKNAIESGRLAHAYLFVGPRGIGKTSTARILAKALNCENGPATEPCNECTNCEEVTAGNSLDVIEIDAASNSGVDDVRELRDHVRFAPVRSRFKVYIIDEVHMLSKPAFNALLKTLEEPPAHTKFVLATTEVHKIPATVISRCQRFDFHRIAEEDISERLKQICVKEKVKFEEEALYAIARNVEGALRDAESILDQLISFCDSKIAYEDVDAVLGLVDWRRFHELCSALREGNVTRELEILDDIVAAGKDLGQFARELMNYFRHLLVCKVTGLDKLISMPTEDRAKVAALAEQFGVSELLALVQKSAEVAARFRGHFAGRIALEVFLMSATKLGTETSVNAVLDKLLTLEERLSDGVSDALAGKPDGEKAAPVNGHPRSSAPVAEPPSRETTSRKPARDLPPDELKAKLVDELGRENGAAAVEEREVEPPSGLLEPLERAEGGETTSRKTLVSPDDVAKDEKVKLVLDLFNGEIVHIEHQRVTE